jgi:hypothetical protein
MFRPSLDTLEGSRRYYEGYQRLTNAAAIAGGAVTGFAFGFGISLASNGHLVGAAMAEGFSALALGASYVAYREWEETGEAIEAGGPEDEKIFWAPYAAENLVELYCAKSAVGWLIDEVQREHGPANIPTLRALEQSHADAAELMEVTTQHEVLVQQLGVLAQA